MPVLLPPPSSLIRTMKFLPPVWYPTFRSFSSWEGENKQKFPFGFLEALLQAEQRSGVLGQSSLQVTSRSCGFGSKMHLDSLEMRICRESAFEEEGFVSQMP